MNAIREFDAYFVHAGISDNGIEMITALFQKYGMRVDVSHRSLEFSATVKGDGHRVIELFKAVADVIREADGELSCSVDEEAIDPRFEFFSIGGGSLWMQRASIVREQEKVRV